jgi:hypothetical protein
VRDFKRGGILAGKSVIDCSRIFETGQANGITLGRCSRLVKPREDGTLWSLCKEIVYSLAASD